MKYIGIDIGSSFIKSAVLDTEQLSITQILRQKTPNKMRSTNTILFEIDPLEIVHTVMEMISQHLNEIGLVNGIMLSTQMHGYILCDEKMTAVTPYVSWQDTRCLDLYKGGSINYMERLSELIEVEDIKRTGIKLKPRLACCNLFHWIENNKPLASNKKINFCTLGSYVIFRLTGRNACHITNAAATGFMDITKGEWNSNIIKAVGCKDFEFPPVLKENQVCGYYSSAVGDVPVYPDIGDHQATVLGTLAKNEQDAIITVGTAGIVSRITRDSTYSQTYETRPYFDGYVLQTVTQLPGGRHLDVLVNFVDQIGKNIYGISMDKKTLWKNIFMELKSDTTKNVEVELGFFKDQFGTNQGKISDINAQNLTVGSIFKGAFLNMAHIYSATVETMFESLSTIDRFILSGGIFSENPFLLEAVERVSGEKVQLSPVNEEALMGLLQIARRIIHG